MTKSTIEIQEVQNVTYSVDGRVYKTIEEAQAAKDALANLERGLR